MTEYQICFPYIRLYLAGGNAIDIAASVGTYENLVQALAHQAPVFAAEMAGSRSPVAVDLRVVHAVALYRDMDDYRRTQEHRSTMNEFAREYMPGKPTFE